MRLGGGTEIPPCVPQEMRPAPFSRQRYSETRPELKIPAAFLVERQARLQGTCAIPFPLAFVKS